MADDRTDAGLGTYFMGGTSAYTGKKFSMLEINADAVFTRLTAKHSDGSTYDALVSQNLTGYTVTAGRTLAVPFGDYFSAITMSSGSCVGIITESTTT